MKILQLNLVSTQRLTKGGGVITQIMWVTGCSIFMKGGGGGGIQEKCVSKQKFRSGRGAGSEKLHQAKRSIFEIEKQEKLISASHQ